MARDANGNYTLPAGNPVVADNLIEADWANVTVADLAAAIQDSLSRSGKGGMLGGLKAFSGSTLAPGYAWADELSSGWYRASAGNFRFAIGGVDQDTITAALRIVRPPLTLSDKLTVAKQIDGARGADIASAATIDLTAATGNLVHVTGATNIAAVTLGSGMMRQVIFDGVLTLTHHATNNNLPGGADITTAVGDRALYWADGVTVYCVTYQKANGSAVIPPAPPDLSNLVAKTGAQSMAGPLTVTGAVTAAPDSLIKNQGAGLPDRGGRLLLEKPVNGTLASNIAVEVGADGVPNRARIGETGGTNRGVFFDLSKAGAGVTSDANFIVAESLGANGYRKYSDDLIVQWGVSEPLGDIVTSRSATVTYPISFPNTFFVVIPMIETFDGVFEEFAVFNRSASSTSQGVFVAREVTGAAQSSWRFSYIAIGN